MKNHQKFANPKYNLKMCTLLFHLEFPRGTQGDYSIVVMQQVG